MGNGILPRTSEWKRFIVYTYHKPLKSMGTLNRLTLAMLDLDFEVRYKKGSEMLADFLSRSSNKLVLFLFWTKIGCLNRAVAAEWVNVSINH